jgi:ABC-type antimicrobial peptide transport system permease subunit
MAFGDMPLSFHGSASRPWMLGTGPWDNTAAFTADSRRASANYFETLGIRVLRGRPLGPSDDENAPLVAVVNDAFVRRFVPGQDVIGVPLQAAGSILTIVGVVDDVRILRPTLAPRPAVYTSLAQMPTTYFSIAVRTPNETVVARAVRDLVRQIDADTPVAGVASMAGRLANAEARRRFYLAMMVLFGGLAGVLAAFGVYSVTAHVARLRRRELTIRLALGARPRSLQALVLRQGILPVSLGVAAGVLAAWWVTAFLQANPVFRSLLYEVTPQDPWTFAAVAVGLFVVALLACWLPARTVNRLEPISVLKSE